MFKSSSTVLFLILFAQSCNANSLIEEVDIEIPGENREESSVVETKGAVKVPGEDNIFGDETNAGEKDLEVDEDHLKEEGQKSVKSRQRRAVCGFRTYNPAFDMCCRGTVQSRSGLSPACCGTRSYDARFYMCCGGTIQGRSGFRPACCGTRSYDAEFHLCCGGTIQGRSGFRPACCGTQVYDAQFRSCCAGRIC